MSCSVRVSSGGSHGAASKPILGRMLRVDGPEWEPLFNLAPDHVGDFMWMFAVQLADGTRLQAIRS
jgi:hypothetical protein